jgi:hypothetical protein
MRKILVEFVPGLLGGIVGGVAGFFIYRWLLSYRLYAIVFPGALTGLACGLLSRTDSKVRGSLSAVEALAIGLFSYWMTWVPGFDTDGTFVDLATKAYKLPPPTLLMLGLGVALGFWWGKECTLRGRLIRNKSIDPE